MRGGAALVAIAASIGNFLQGWDNATIAGAIVYMKEDLDLTTTVEGIVVAMSLIGATIITTSSGPILDWIGRHPMLIMSSVLYFVSGLVMLWSPNVYVLLLARLIDGFGIGLSVTLVPVYISETAPADIRGLLNTLPQFSGSVGLFLSYCMVFGMSLTFSPSWKLMLGILYISSLVYFALAVFFLPESPRWLLSKGKMMEAKKVLQRLRGREDVSEWHALYTTQITQIAKKYHSGFIRLSSCGSHQMQGVPEQKLRAHLGSFALQLMYTLSGAGGL